MIPDSEKLDLLWKRIAFGTSKTAKAADKAGSNETVPSPLPVYPSAIWGQAGDIPASAPAATDAVVEVRSGADRVACTTDPTSTPNLTWFATAAQGDVLTRLTDFIAPTFGSSYAVRVFIGDPNVGPAARIFPDTTDEEWVFDYAAGVLLFASNIPGAKTATIGAGTVSVDTDGVYIEGYRYVGERGVPQPGGQNGFAIPLGPIEDDGDGTWDGGAVTLTDATPVSEAVDMINEVLGKLIPAQPPAFPGATVLSVSNAAGASPRLADGVTDNAASTLTPGSAVTRITAAGVSTNVLGDVGPGDAGTVSVLLNGTLAASRVLAGTGDNGTYSGLVIADQKDFPVATPGFWKSIDVSLNLLAAPAGVNKMRISHSEAGQTAEVFFLREAAIASPAISGGSVTEAEAGTLAYSSGVPHYGSGASLTVALAISNLAGETYYGGADPLVISGTNNIISADTLAYAALGIATPIARQTTAPVAIDPVLVAVDGNVHAQGVIQAVARNVNGASAATTVQAKTILVKRGSAGASKIDEMSVTAVGVTAARVGLGAGATPAGAPSAWDSTAALATHEAAVVGGVLKHDQTDYSAFLPAGPNLSTGRGGDQFATFSFKRAALSAFKINVTGAYADCRIKLPGASDDQPNAPNGWWNAFQPYDGAGIPGEAGDTAAGCALGAVMTGGSGTFQITFGTESSTNADDNEILVRFRLTPGQTITALSFSA